MLNIPYSDQLTLDEINSFINNRSEFSDRELDKIRNTQEIDLTSATDTMDTFYGIIGSMKQIIEESINEIEALLTASNSNLLSNGDNAEAHKQYLKDIDEEISNIYKACCDINENYKSFVNEYNSGLKKLKRAVKFQLLHRIADAINAEAEAKRATYEYPNPVDCGDTDYKSNNDDSKDKLIETNIFGEGLGAIFVSLVGEERKTENGKETITYNLRKHYVAYCNYWKTSSLGKHDPKWYNPFTWGDDTVDELEKKISTLSERFSDINKPSF